MLGDCWEIIVVILLYVARLVEIIVVIQLYVARLVRDNSDNRNIIH